MSKEISKERKITYYIGMGLIVIGFLLFISNFVTFIMNFGNFSSTGFSSIVGGFARAFIGMIMMIAGGITMAIGSQGLAGSGVILDPKRARRDRAPFSKMYGGMVKDGLDGAGININNIAEKIGGNSTKQTATTEIIKIKCRACSALNNEKDNFCSSCGQKL
ncbi:hypothetical protein AAEX28_09395 [Lentisphaerota bacterium WC36G]|nr:hypothetical protein LJT99_12235 [Lentisphaerae bacterium WC36]